jgi:phosphoribosylformimino-5-aminoimidazole carboxamide ribotide isomerase
MFEVIPAIDILGGQVVRLTQGDYGQVDRYEKGPAETAQSFYSAGATRIHLVDLDGAKDGHLVNLETIKSIRNSVDCTLELGGGIRSVETAALLFDLGIDYVILGSLLVKEFEIAKAIINRFPNRIIAGIDAKDGLVATEGWLELGTLTAVALVKHLNQLPLASIIYTDIAKDGTLAGPNLVQLEQIAEVSVCPVIASGGVGTKEHITQVRYLADKGISGCIVGKAVLSGLIRVEELFSS